MIETKGSDIEGPVGLAFSPAANLFLVLDKNQSAARKAKFVMISHIEDLAGSVNVATAIADPINSAFDVKANRLLFFDASLQQLGAIKANAAGKLDSSAAAIKRFDGRQFGLAHPRGVTLDPASGRLYILDASSTRIVRIIPDAQGDFDGGAAQRDGRISQIDLRGAGLATLQSIAFNSENNHLYLLSTAKKEIYEITEAGDLVATRDFSSIDTDLQDPEAMVFAHSGDLTDDPSQMSLYVADGGKRNGKASSGYIVELSLTQPSLLDPSGATALQATLANTTTMSQWSPSSPDPMGVAYVSTSNRLLISDSEVEEMSIFAGVNVFDATLQGGLVNTFSTLAFSDEPTGVAFNPNNQHLFFSDDDADEVFEIDPGPDGNYFTGDDILTSFDTRSINNMDAEDIAYGNGNLYIADGLNAEVYEIRPGPNGRFDGQPPVGDDQANHFDTSSLDIPDPEAVEFNSSTGTLYITGRGSKKVIETTTSGSLLSVIDITFLNAKNPSGLAYAPGGINPAETNLYIIARGIDNDSNPDENDGKMYEISIVNPSPIPSISINDVAITEGNAGTVNAVFTVTLSASSSQTVTVNYATANGTATAGSDYIANSNTLSFPTGTTTQTISVAVNGDAFGEPDETFFVNLSDPANATIADNQGQGTIVNDDPPPTTLVFNPAHDTRVKHSSPSSNFGTSTVLILKHSSSTIQNSYLKFDVSGVSGTVQSAKLRLQVIEASNSGGSVYPVSNNYLGTSTPWTETGLIYNNAPVISGTPLSTVGSVAVGQVVEFDVTAAITGNGTISFGMSTSSSNSVYYSSKEGSAKPELVIQLRSGAAGKASENQETASLLPERFNLSPNYPNPFNAQTVIEYALPKEEKVRLIIYNITGQMVRTLVDESQPAGYKRVIWDGADDYGREVSTGIYFFQLQIDGQQQVRKMIVQR